jgi:putative phosphoesterase
MAGALNSDSIAGLPDMRLHVLSDLHLDYPQNRNRLSALVAALKEHPADVLVVPGDLSHKTAQVDEALRHLADLAPTRLFVAGNHDVWVVKPKPEEATDSWRKLDAFGDLCRQHGFHYLEEGNLDVAGLTFIGSMLWYDYSFANARLNDDRVDYADKRWRDLTYMDREYAKWGVPDADVALRLATALEKRLSSASGRKVFVSHHVPLEELVLRRGVDGWDFFNAYMGSRRVERLLREHGVERFIFGHTHRPVALVEPGRFVINNPVGYPRQALNPNVKGFQVD